MANPNWKPGTSGNPKGRPKKGRTWTDLLDKAGRRMLSLPDGPRMSAKRVIARYLIDLALGGETTLVTGGMIKVVDSEDWFNVVKFIYAQIDGPPKQEIGVDFTRLSDAQLIAFITTGIAALGGSDSGGAAPEADDQPANRQPPNLP